MTPKTLVLPAKRSTFVWGDEVKRMSARLWLLLGLSLVAAPVARADDEKVVYEKKQVVDFDSDTIEGDLTKPDGDVFDARKKAKRKNLIRVRSNFRSEVLQSIRSL